MARAAGAGAGTPDRSAAVTISSRNSHLDRVAEGTLTERGSAETGPGWQQVVAKTPGAAGARMPRDRRVA
jgi:hypothetical protein